MIRAAWWIALIAAALFFSHMAMKEEAQQKPSLKRSDAWTPERIQAQRAEGKYRAQEWAKRNGGAP